MIQETTTQRNRLLVKQLRVAYWEEFKEVLSISDLVKLEKALLFFLKKMGFDTYREDFSRPFD